VGALLEGRLPPPAVSDAARHIDRCISCRAVFTDVVRGFDAREGGLMCRVEGGARSTLRCPGEAGSTRIRPLSSGSVVGRYVALESIGAGSMGVVYRAHDPRLGRCVALKLVRTDAGATPSRTAQARLLREAQALARVSHPNVIAIYDVGTCDGGAFLAMELVEGGTLADWLRSPRSWRDIVGMFRSAGEGLAAAHAAGLVHRDFKPANVLVGKDGRARVTDFGLVCAVGDLATHQAAFRDAGPDHLLASMTRTGTLIGTPAYMAPEQMRGGKADARSDVFSFCVALYEALYGERPFQGATLGEVSRAMTRGAIRPAPRGTKVPGWLRAILVGALQADPDQRLGGLPELLGAIEAGLAIRRLLAPCVSSNRNGDRVWSRGISHGRDV
jgi:serine/threonine protein kinase